MELEPGANVEPDSGLVLGARKQTGQSCGGSAVLDRYAGGGPSIPTAVALEVDMVVLKKKRQYFFKNR